MIVWLSAFFCLQTTLAVHQNPKFHCHSGQIFETAPLHRPSTCWWMSGLMDVGWTSGLRSLPRWMKTASDFFIFRHSESEKHRNTDWGIDSCVKQFERHKAWLQLMQLQVPRIITFTPIHAKPSTRPGQIHQFAKCTNTESVGCFVEKQLNVQQLTVQLIEFNVQAANVIFCWRMFHQQMQKYCQTRTTCFDG